MKARLGVLTAVLLLLPALCVSKTSEWTPKHEKGRCALRGQCGKDGWFGPELPCPDNGLAETPDEATREKLLDLCGDSWADSDVCCNEQQIDTLASNLKKANQFISACPACKKNFFNLFCTFTCSPDQSLFVNVTDTKMKGGKEMVMEIDQLISTNYGSGFYNSCKDVKFGATNSKAMAFIGGGASNFTDFLKFLGHKSALGSPFQINFPRPEDHDFKGMTAMNETVRSCNSTEEAYRCSCIDCEDSCPALPEIAEAKVCRVGALPCLSFAVIIIYSVFIGILIIAVSGHVAYKKHSKQKNERLRLLQDIEPSDDEDEGDIVHAHGMLDGPTKHYSLNTMCDNAFNSLGKACASYPVITILFSILMVGLLSMGWLKFAVEKDPVRLWVAPNSAAAQEKQFFDEQFGPFFRAEQAFIVRDGTYGEPGPVMSYDTLRWWFDVESRVKRLKSMKEGVTFQDVCYNPTGSGCVVQSITGYFQGDFANVNPKTWNKTIDDCSKNPVECLPDFKQPLMPHMVVGGGWDMVPNAKALVVTWVVRNHAQGSEEEARAMDWENSLKSLLVAVRSEAKERGLRLSFSTEVSLEQELSKSTNTDAKIVVISYVIMFIYASLALGSTTLTLRTIVRNPSTALVQSKFLLGVVGILIVLMSVSASVGLFSAAGIKVTLIIAEVIPFLVLAVGVDNIFLIVHEFERVNVSHPEGSIPERVGRALGRMGPSILFSASTETAAFALGTAVGMPAVRNFAAYAAGAVFINALLQVTMFTAVLALNQTRVEARRADCFPFIKLPRANSGSSHGGLVYGSEEEGSLQKFIRKTYAPLLLGKKAKVVIVTLFLGFFTAGVALLPKVELGLDQRVALPSDSYLIPYFNDLYDYFNAGPPVYFVTRELNVTERSHQQQLCAKFTTCKEYSLANVIEQERKRSGDSYISYSAASWIDDFFFWLYPEDNECCMDNGQTCFTDRNPPWNITLSGMPEGQEFIHYLERWIKDQPTEECAIAGKAAYSDAIVIDDEHLTINASHFRSSHTPLRSQSDFIAAYASARRIADTITAETGASVFPYSKFYIFFDQYRTIVRLSVTLIGSALAIIFVIASALLGSIQTGAVVTVTVAMTVIDIAGSMAVMGVSLNAVSLVNLVICVGISVEFCAHVARAFAFPSSTVMERVPRNRFNAKDARAWAALCNVGASVFTGITLTKLLGVFVLAFTRSKIFEIYYFRIWLALVVWAATHALVFLPVALSLFGGKGYVDPESDGGLEQDLRSRRYPGLLAEDDYDSE